MNLHHLELFYYVARHGGIAAACRKMPYGIQQPAVSSQLLSLEKDLDLRLFHRRPFALTPAGERLYDHLLPFFTGLDDLERDLRGHSTRELRLAGAGELLRYHVPDLVRQLRPHFPELRLRVFERDQHTAQQMVEQGETGLAITVQEQRLPRGFTQELLIELPMCLLHDGRLTPQEIDAFREGRAAPPHGLISSPPREPIMRLFRRELEERDITWPTSIEAGGGEQIVAYAQQGMGVGLWAVTPGVPHPQGVFTETLTGFPPIPIAVFWKGRLSRLEEQFLEHLRTRATKFREQLAAPASTPVFHKSRK
jgi:DNA-binding transcriptional LysR family regulator